MSLERIGRYEIVGELGRGAMGVVYKATDPNIGRTVALKTMRVDVHGLESADLMRRFKNEARAAGLLNHPNIVTIYDAGEHDGVFYIAMECLEGTTLQELLAERRMEPAEVVRFSPGNLQGSGLRPLARHRAPRREAGQHHDHPLRHGEDHGFRHRQSRRQHDRYWPGAGHSQLHVARAG